MQISVLHHTNPMEDKNNRIISIDAEKASHKLQHAFMIKALHKLCIEGMYLNVIKTVHNKLTINVLNGERLKSFPLRTET